MAKALIIGAGIGGIAASIRLAIKGYDVQVFERNSFPGGKLSSFSRDGFRFDFGPSLFTLPSLVDELFIDAGRNPRDYFQYEKLPIACRYFYEDGTQINAFTDVGLFSEEVHRKLGIPAGVIKNYLNHSQRIFRYTRPVFLDRSLHRWKNYLRLDTLAAFLRIWQFDVFRSMDNSNRRRLRHPKLVQLFNRFATYNGSSPYKASGILNVIPSLEHLDGAFFPIGGMYSITKSLVRLAEELGVTFSFNSEIKRLQINNGLVDGVIIGGQLVEGDVVVSNMDVYPTYKKLMPDQKAPERILRQERSSSALVFYWGMNKSFPMLDVHNIFFSENYPLEFEHLFYHKSICDDPTIYVHISSKVEPDDAPSNMENWFVMVNAPALDGQDWDTVIRESRARIIDKLSRVLQQDIEPYISTESITDPRTIESKTLSHVGALYGTSSNSLMAAFFRHSNFHKRFKNLYFCGGSVHPGGGIPLCLMSAKIVASNVS